MFSVTYPTKSEDERIGMDGLQADELVGCILWLKAADQCGDHVTYGLTRKACNHPCMVVGTRSANTDEDLRLTIWIITSFKHKTDTARAVLTQRASLIPIFPNDASTSIRRVELRAGVRLRRDSWVQIAARYEVPLTFLSKYDRYRPEQHFKLTTSSIRDIQTILSLSPSRPSLMTTTQSTSNRINQYTANARDGSDVQDQVRRLEALTSESLRPLLQQAVRETRYGTYTSFRQSDYAQRQPRDLERQSSSLRLKSRLVRFRNQRAQDPPGSPTTWSIQSQQNFSSWLPSGGTIANIIIGLVVLGLFAAAGYGFYLLFNLIYMFIANVCEEVAAIWSDSMAAVSHVCQGVFCLLKSFGSEVAEMKDMFLAVKGKIVGAVKALFGQS